MRYIKTEIEGVWILQPEMIQDARGYFFEAFKADEFKQHVNKNEFIQENQSQSSLGVLRGLHYQKGEYSQAKLVRVLQGTVLDVAVDLRQNSPTFGHHIAVTLSSDNQQQLYIPRGFAHGFYVLSNTATFLYKVDNIYAPQHEVTINYNDPTLNIKWPITDHNLLLSEKDKKGVAFENAIYF